MAIKFVNVGKGIARNIDVIAFVELVDANLEARIDRSNSPRKYAHAHLVSGIMFPDGWLDMNAVRVRWKDANAGMREPDPLTTAELSSLTAGTAYLTVYGVVNYEDVFGVAHWTHFCKWVPFSKEQRGYRAYNCTEYNQADNN